MAKLSVNVLDNQVALPAGYCSGGGKAVVDGTDLCKARSTPAYKQAAAATLAQLQKRFPGVNFVGDPTGAVIDGKTTIAPGATIVLSPAMRFTSARIAGTARIDGAVSINDSDVSGYIDGAVTINASKVAGTVIGAQRIDNESISASRVVSNDTSKPSPKDCKQSVRVDIVDHFDDAAHMTFEYDPRKYDARFRFDNKSVFTQCDLPPPRIDI